MHWVRDLVFPIWGVICLNIGRFWGRWEGKKKGRVDLATEILEKHGVLQSSKEDET